jgi:hypothetical protein
MSIKHEKYPVIGGGEDDFTPLIELSLAVPTQEQLKQIYEPLLSGEFAFRHKWPELADRPDGWFNQRREGLAGPETSIRDFNYLLSKQIWTENDANWLKQVSIDPVTGCWRMPYYIEKSGPMENRARYPQPYAYDFERKESYKMMGMRWMWQRTVGPIGTNDKEINARTGLEGLRGSNVGALAATIPRHPRRT